MNTIHLYHLIVDNKVKYIGLTKSPVKRKSDHKRKRPTHEFIIIKEFTDIEEASNEEHRQITEYNTYKDGWNKDPGGNYGSTYGKTRKVSVGVKKGVPLGTRVSQQKTLELSPILKKWQRRSVKVASTMTVVNTSQSYMVKKII